ncbi:MAG: hypothetical protein II752_07005 [Muribaculaceae bacterium]|nr:hypothetical protein [Muribaculaceae bacterium]
MTDKELKDKIMSAVKEPADDPLFARKVVNCIPERRRSKADRVMAVTYGLASLAVVGGWIYMIAGFDMKTLFTPVGWLSVLLMSALSTVIYVKAAKYA